MDKKQIRKEIATLINSIKEHSDNIGDKQHIPQLELELILNKIEKLYQKSIVFNHLNSVGDYFPKGAVKSDKIIEKTTEEKAPVNVITEIKKEVVMPHESSATDITKNEKIQESRKSEIKQDQKKPQEKTQVNIARPMISDIRAAIGINDKFRFANELFNGNIQEYEIAVTQLNAAESLDSATEYFMSIQQLYNWDNENESVKSLYDLVERRFS